MSDQDRLIQARDLIKSQKYQEARAILKTLPSDRPIAQKWLAKLDEIAPVPPTDPPPSVKSRPISSPKRDASQLANQPLIQFKEPFEPPIDPLFAGFSVRASPRAKVFLILVLYGIGLARNWRRLGRASWETPTLILSLSIVGVSCVTGILGIAWIPAMNLSLFNQRDLPIADMLGFGVLGASLGINLAFILSLILLQRGAYSQWADFGNKEAMYTHSYDFITASLVGILVVMLTFLIGAAYGYSENQLQTFETRHFTVKTSNDWGEETKERYAEQIYCQNSDNGCELYLSTMDNGITRMELLLTVENESYGNIKDEINSVEAYMREETEAFTFIKSYQATLSGQKAGVIEYREHDEPDENSYNVFIFVLAPDGRRFEVLLSYLNEEHYQRYKEDGLALLNNLQVTP